LNVATIVDSLIVTLGLDGKDFEKGQKKTQEALEKTRKDADKTARDMEHAGKQAAQFFSKMRNEALAFFAALAVGSGLKSFVENSIVAAAGVGRLSDNLDISTKRLTAWQQAAERAGGSAGGALAQLKQSADDVAKFKMGMGSDSLNWFFRMGGSTDDLKDGNTYLMARADIVKRIFDVDPTKAAVIAQSMGISDDQFNLIKKGSAAIEDLIRERERYSKFSREDAENADKLRSKMLDLRDSFELASTKLLIKLTPQFEKLAEWLNRLADWVNSNGDLISKWVDDSIDKAIPVLNEFVGILRDTDWREVANDIKGLASAFLSVGHEIKGMIDGAKSLKEWWDRPSVPGGHWWNFGFRKSTDIAENDIRNGRNPRPGQLGGGKITSINDRQKYILDKLRKDGFSDAQAAGIVGSLMQESGLNSTQVNAKSGAIGIAQWLGSRKKGFADRYGHGLEKSTFEEQVDYMLWEMRNTEKHSGDLLRRASSPQIAAQIHAWEYERPGVAEANIGRRQSYAESLFASIGQGNAMAAANLPTSASMPTMRYGGSPNSTVSSETHIGQITIQTAATDANGIAKDAQSAFQRYAFASQSNTGLN
jgi:hypothetical protein